MKKLLILIGTSALIAGCSSNDKGTGGLANDEAFWGAQKGSASSSSGDTVNDTVFINGGSSNTIPNNNTGGTNNFSSKSQGGIPIGVGTTVISINSTNTSTQDLPPTGQGVSELASAPTAEASMLLMVIPVDWGTNDSSSSFGTNSSSGLNQDSGGLGAGVSTNSGSLYNNNASPTPEAVGGAAAASTNILITPDAGGLGTNNSGLDISTNNSGGLGTNGSSGSSGLNSSTNNSPSNP